MPAASPATFADGTTMTVNVVAGWYLIAIRYSRYGAGYGETACSSAGTTIGWRGSPGPAPGQP